MAKALEIMTVFKKVPRPKAGKEVASPKSEEMSILIPNNLL